MKSSAHFGPFVAPHRTRQFWGLVTLLTITALVEPFILRALGAPLPSRPYSSWLGTVAIGLLILIPVVWLAFRLGRIGWLVVGLGFMVFALVARSLSL